jgi:SsrA-binding protein
MRLSVGDDSIKVVATNRKAGRDYFLDDRLEAGIVLQGTEVKSVRAGQVSLAESYVRLDGREAWLVNAHIAPYDPASRLNHDARRTRKLLLHRREIARLFAKVKQRGFTVIPTKMYFRRGRAKIEIALARGKRKYDKRLAIAKRDAARDMERAVARRRRK